MDAESIERRAIRQQERLLEGSLQITALHFLASVTAFMFVGAGVAVVVSVVLGFIARALFLLADLVDFSTLEQDFSLAGDPREDVTRQPGFEFWLGKLESFVRILLIWAAWQSFVAFAAYWIAESSKEPLTRLARTACEFFTTC